MYSLLVILSALVVFVAIGMLLSLLILFVRAKCVRSAPCQIFINDRSELTKSVEGGVSLLSALLNNKILIPSPCGGKATCKQCRVCIKEGASPPLETEKATFSKEELQAGMRLSCQCKVKQDIKIALPLNYLEVQQLKATVVSNRSVATFIKELIVVLKEPISYRSGAYLQLYIPPFTTNTSSWKESMDPKFYGDWEKYGLFDQRIDFSHLEEGVARAYSMASYPEEGRELRFTIRIATPPMNQGRLTDRPWGVGSSYGFSLKPGDEVYLSGPYGESFMKSGERELFFLIGGAGASFARSHILHLFHTEKTKRGVHLFYGARSLRENIYEKEFRELAAIYPNFTYHLVLSEPLEEDFVKGWPKKGEDPLKTNLLFKAFELAALQQMQEPEEALYYVCGPPLHNKSVMQLLDDYGVGRKSIVLDDFGN